MALAVQVPGEKGQGIPILAWGPSGGGKTSLIEKMAACLNAAFFNLNLQTKIPEDLGGFAVPDPERGIVQHMPPVLIEEIRKTQEDLVILFIDEANTADRAMQAAELQLLTERRMGDIKLPDKVAIVGAANPVDEAANAQELADAFANRWIHIEWEIPSDYWIQAFLSGYRQRIEVPVLDINEWKKKLVQVRGMVAGYLRRQPQHIRVKRQNEREYAWPNERKWEWLTRLLAAVQATGEEDLRMPLVFGAIGEGVGNEFLTYLREVDLPDPEWLLDNPDRLQKPRNPDSMYATLTAVVAAIKQHLTDERFHAGWRILARAVDLGYADTAATAANDLYNVYKDNISRLTFPVEIRSFGPLFEEAGLIVRRKDGASAAGRVA